MDMLSNLESKHVFSCLFASLKGDKLFQKVSNGKSREGDRLGVLIMKEKDMNHFLGI
jgi:hypothetical protein